MNAREKLNVAYVRGGLIVAAGLGVLVRSRAVFTAALAILIAGGLYDGTIRPRRRGR